MFRWSTFLVLCLAMLAPTAMAAATPAHAINIFVSILPQKYLAERVGGKRVKVAVMVRPGLSPETYEPTPRQMAALAGAELYFRAAVPFESVWIKQIQNLNPRLRIVGCCNELITSDPDRHDHEESNSDVVNDAHVWTSPENAIVLAGIIRDALVEHDPAAAYDYSANYLALVKDLKTLDAWIRQALAGIEQRYLIVSHPSWGHYARTYDLEQIAIERHGTEIRARELARLIEFARQKNIHTVYVQKQFNTAAAKILAREIDGKVVELDPLAEDYIENLRHVTRLIVEGAKEK